MTDLRTVPEVAATLRISVRSTWRLVHDGRIRVVHPTPGRTCVTSKEVAAYLASLERRVA